jgi:hypothetical protein
MKSLIVLASLLALLACQSNKNGVATPGTSAAPGSTPASGPSNRVGGVDVGNLSSGIVPHTNVSMNYAKNSWVGSANDLTLVLRNSSGSTITAKKSELTSLASPSAIGLKGFLESKYPQRSYKVISVNGLQGVRADFVSSKSEKKSDIYLVSELQDFVHVEADLKSSGDGIAAGDLVISTARVKYLGEAVQNAPIKTVTLNAYSRAGMDLDKRAAYSFKGDCYSYVDQGCNGVSILFGNGEKSEITVGNAGYQHGRIIDLGDERMAPFASVVVNGEYLIAPEAKIPLADIYTVFTPKNLQSERDRQALEAGHVYLIRTLSWPDEDIITKVKVESLVEGRSVTLTYQKLTTVRPQILQKQVDEINRYTIENEKPLSEGEVVLYNRSISNSYFFAAFNFEYSTTGNMYITRNDWDLLFQNGGDGRPTLLVPHTGSAIGGVVDFGTKSLQSLSRADFPDSNTYVRDNRPAVIRGNVYGIYHRVYNEKIGTVYGAVQVLDLAPDNSWVRLKFKRIYLGAPEHFQKWVSLQIPSALQKVTLEKADSSSKMAFYPFIMKRGDEGRHYYEQFYFTPAGNGYPASLMTDYRPFGKDRGFVSLGANFDFERLSVADIENKKGSMKSNVELKIGDVIAANLENYFDKTILVLKVEALTPDQSVTFSIRYLERAKTPYSDDTL